MELGDFTKQMNRMTSTWEKITNVDRLPRYYKFVKDLPLDAMKEIVESLLDSSTKMPLPNDFKSLASEWRKHYFLQHGHVYGTDKAISTDDTAIECEICFDCGITKIEHLAPSSFKGLMRCSCAAGKKSNTLIPQWSQDVAGAFKRVAIDPKWFNPHANETEALIDSEKKVFNKVMEWKRILTKSENYWSELGYK